MIANETSLHKRLNGAETISNSTSFNYEQIPYRTAIKGQEKTNVKLLNEKTNGQVNVCTRYLLILFVLFSFFYIKINQLKNINQ